jgi:adenylate cyclase
MAIQNGDRLKCVEDVRLVRTLNGAIRDGLRNQQAILQMRSVSVPDNVIDSASGIDTQLEHLEATLLDEQTEIDQLRALTQTSAMINSSLDLDQVLSGAMDEIIKLTGAGRGFILLRNRETDVLEFRVIRADEDDDRQDVSRSIIEQVMASKQPLLTDNASSDPRVQKSTTVGKFTLRSILCVPLIYRDKVTGAIYVDHRFKEAVFTARELNLLTAFANQTAVAIENAILFAQVQATLVEITRVKELMENVFASIASGVITTDDSHAVTTFNRAASHIFAVPTDDVIGRTLESVAPHVGDFDQLLHAARGGRSMSIEAQTHIAGRGQVELNFKLSPLKDGAQETVGVAVVVDDLTEQREREQTLGMAQRYLPPGMVNKIHQIAGLALGGERREVTCMFIFVAPYAAFPPNLRGQGLTDALNQFLETATDALHHQGGIIDKYMGNEIMVVFNSQLNPQDDHALRAVSAALELRDGFLRLYQRLGIDPQPHLYRVGMHTGVATLGNVGSLNRRNFTAIGDSINLSKRLQENAAPGQIIVSDDVLTHMQQAGAVPANIQAVERGSIQVKGRKQLTSIYEVFRV